MVAKQHKVSVGFFDLDFCTLERGLKSVLNQYGDFIVEIIFEVA